MPEVIPGVFIDGKPVPLPPPQATHLALCLDVPNFKGFRKFFLRTIERKNYSCEKYGEGLEGGIKKLKHCLQKGNAKLHYIGEQDNYYTFRVKGPLGGWGLEETIKEFGEFIRHVHLKSSTYGRYLRKNQFMWKFFWCTNKDQILVPLTKEEAAEQEAQDCALAKPIRIPLPQVVRKDAVKILKQLGGVMEILDYLNKRFCPYSFILKGSPRTLYIDNCPADAWDGSEAKREVKELFSEMTNLAVEKKRRNLTLQANATKTLIQKAKAKEALPSAEDAETPVLKVPKEHQPWPHEPRQLQRHEDESAETPVLKVEEKKKAQVMTAKEEATAKDAVLAPSRAQAREKTLQAMRRRAKSVEADTCEAAGNRVKDIIAKKEDKKEEHSPAKVERKPVILKAAQARAQEETRDEPQPEKKKIILKAASEIAAEQASQVQEEEADYNEGAVRARQQDLQEKMKMCLAKANIQKKEDNRTTDNDKTAVKQKDLAEVEYRFFSRGVADAKDQGDDIEEDEAGDTEVEDASDEEQEEAKTADVTEAGDTEVEDASDEEDEEQEDKAKTADVTQEAEESEEDGRDRRDRRNGRDRRDRREVKKVGEQRNEKETHQRPRHRQRRDSKALHDSKGCKSPPAGAKQEQRRRRRRSRRREPRSRRRERRKDEDEERRPRQQEVEEARRKKEEEQRQRAEEDERRRKLEEEARRKKEEEQRQRAEEDERRRKLEEEARRKKEEEQRQRAEEDERRRKLEEEARRKKEEEQRQRAEEDERRIKLEEEARRKKEEEQRQRAEEDERRRKLEEEARRKKEEEQRQRAEAEELKKLKEEVRKKKEEEKRRQEEEKAARSEEEGSWSPQDGQDQDEDKEENKVAKRRRTKQARRLTKANERRIMQGWTWRNQFQEALAPEAKKEKQEEAEEAEEVLRQKADEAERKRQQMMEEARQREKAQAEEKRRMQEEASQGEKVEEEERRKLEEVPRIQEAAHMPHMLQVPAQMRPPTRPKAPYPSGIRLRVFEKAGARELPERRIVKQALTFGTGGHCDVVLPPGPGVQGEHLKLGHHELKGWSLQPISGISVQSAVACYPALLEKLQLECQSLPQGQKKDEVIDLLYRLSKDERTSRLTQGGEGRLKLSENLCVFTLGNAKTPKRLYFLDLIFGELLKEDPLMDLAEVAPVPAAPKEVPQMAEIQVQGPEVPQMAEIQVQGPEVPQMAEIQVQGPEAEEAPCDPADPAQEDMQVSETVEQNQAAPTAQDVPSEPDATHADADTVDAMQSMTAPVPDETPSKAQQVETLHAADGELLCEDVEDARPDHDDQSHTRQEDPEQVEAKMGEEQQEDTTVEAQQDAEMPALSKEVLGGEDPFAEDDASGSEHVSHVSEVTQEDSPKDADVKDLKELSEPKEGQDEHAAEVAEAAKTEVPLVTPEVAATVATSKAPGPQIVRPAAKPKAIPSKVVEVKHHYDGPVADFVQQAENLALQKYAKRPLIGHRPRNETWRWRARRAPVAEDEKLSKDPGASPIDGFPDSGETWKDIAKARATRIILKRVREEADASRNEWQKQREKKRRMPLPPKVPEKIYNHLRNAYKAYKLFSPWLSPVMRIQLTQEIWYTVRYVEDQFADELFWRRAAGEKMDVPIPVHQVKLPAVAVAKKPPMEPPPRKRSRSPRRKPLRFETLKVPVDEVEFSQDSIAQRFTCGRHLQSTVADMRSGELDPLDVKQYPFMKLLALRIDDRIISRCNRRLWCLHEVQRLRRSRKPDHNEYVWVKVQEPSEVLKDMIRKILPPKPRLAARLTDQMVEDDDLGALMADEAED